MCTSHLVCCIVLLHVSVYTGRLRYWFYFCSRISNNKRLDFLVPDISRVDKNVRNLFCNDTHSAIVVIGQLWCPTHLFSIINWSKMLSPTYFPIDIIKIYRCFIYHNFFMLPIFFFFFFQNILGKETNVSPFNVHKVPCTWMHFLSMFMILSKSPVSPVIL